MRAATVPQAFALAIQHHQAGQLAEAEALYRQVLAEQPGHVDALHHLGVIAHQVGRHDLAVDLIRRALQLNPGSAEAHLNLGNALSSLGRLGDASASYRRALELRPDFAEAANNLGTVLAALGRPTEAAAGFRRAIELRRGYPEAFNNLGNVLRTRGEWGEAVTAYGQAIQLRPGYADAHGNLGLALAEQGRHREALAEYQRALDLKPDYAEAHSNLGLSLSELGLIGEAETAHRRALEINPGFADAHNNLAQALKEQGRLDEAIAEYREALRLDPAQPGVHSNLVYTLLFEPSQNPFTIAEEQRRWSSRFAEPFRAIAQLHPNDRNPGRRLRIGYVSPEFRDHVTGRYLVPLLENHDRGDFEIVCYAGVPRPDALTDRFTHCTERWRSTVGVADEELAEMIRRDEVDILVDLTQHLAGNRLPVFARRPAPVQVSFAGYPAGTGLDAIPYRVSDTYVESPAECGGDKPTCLIDTFWCYDPCGATVPTNALPALERGHITFGCVNNFCKVNEAVLALWARVLGEVENSRLVILAAAGGYGQALDILSREGIAAERVQFVPRCPRLDYLKLFHGLDIALDPFPYNGHTTSLDALWMGVPVVSLVGGSAVARAGLSEFSNLGLEELIAFSPDDYVRIAAGLARNLARLAERRATLRPRMEASPLMDAPKFARQIEAAYRTMWRKWCMDRG